MSDTENKPPFEPLPFAPPPVVIPAVRLAWSFVRSHSKAAFAVLGALLLVAFKARRKSDLASSLRTQIEAQTAANTISHTAVNAGIAAAHMQAREAYEQRADDLSDKQRAQAEKLQKDPAALAAFVVKAAKR